VFVGLTYTLAILLSDLSSTLIVAFGCLVVIVVIAAVVASMTAMLLRELASTLMFCVSPRKFVVDTVVMLDKDDLDTLIGLVTSEFVRNLVSTILTLLRDV
jgi:hypothetical protein